MSLGDDAIIPCFTLLTDTPQETIIDIKKRMTDGGNPMVYKKMLAFELTKQLNSEKEADTAQKEFETRFQKGELKDADLPVVPFSKLQEASTIIDLLVSVGIAKSNSEARRLVDQKAVFVNDERIFLTNHHVKLGANVIIRAGRKAVKIGE
jgi:tyrosyl-tRNA synthetase